jgi:hypothetical protein
VAQSKRPLIRDRRRFHEKRACAGMAALPDISPGDDRGAFGLARASRRDQQNERWLPFERKRDLAAQGRELRGIQIGRHWSRSADIVAVHSALTCASSACLPWITLRRSPLAATLQLP